MDDSASGTVTSAGDSVIQGGLVGVSEGDVSSSYATSTVSGGDGIAVGGLIGNNSGSVLGSYAMGSVTAGTGSYIGGLIGQNDRMVDNSFATGLVKGGSSSALGGLVGHDGGGTVTSSYWDTQTTGQSTSAEGGTGRTTAQLQSALPSGFSSGDWSIVAGKSFPYLTWQVPSGTPQVISGTIGGSSDAGISVGISVNGNTTTLVSMASGANGYYYELLAPGTISSSGSDVLVYEASGSTHGDTFDQGAEGSLTSFNLAANTLTVESAATSASSLLSAMEKALGTNSGSDFLYTSSGGFTSGIDLDLDLSGASFSLNRSINIGSGVLDIDASGTVKGKLFRQDRGENLDGQVRRRRRVQQRHQRHHRSGDFRRRQHLRADG